MSLQYDYTRCEKPKDENERECIDMLILATCAVGMSEITKKNAAEFFARLDLCEKIHGPYRTQGAKGIYFTPQEIKRWIGLQTNAQRWTRNQFLTAQTKRRFNNAIKKYDADSAG